MDKYSALTSWTIFGVIITAACWYYWPRQQHRQDRRREDAQHAPGKRRRTEQDNRERGLQRSESEQGADTQQTSTQKPRAARPQGVENTRKRKLVEKPAAPAQAAPSVRVQVAEPEENDTSTRQWAEQMMQARKGHEIGSSGSKEQRVRTVKQNSALNTPVLSSGSSQADDDLSPVGSPDLNAGDVTDMLEPVASGPSTLRVTASTKPAKERVVRQSKEEQIETKKQRQNRQRVEERRLQRGADEKDRKALEEKQRRSARETRGEPARNGMQPARQPNVSAWTASSTQSGTDAPVATGMNHNNQNGPLLDTFDADSLSSSNGGMGASTAATSTTSAGGGGFDYELPSEEDQMAQAMKQSEDESGWTTVAQPKKSKKKADSPLDEPVLSNKTNIPASKPMVNGKPKGFQALDVSYEQRADADPDDSSNWDA